MKKAAFKSGTIVSTIMSNLGFYKALHGTRHEEYSDSRW